MEYEPKSSTSMVPNLKLYISIKLYFSKQLIPKHFSFKNSPIKKSNQQNIFEVHTISHKSTTSSCTKKEWGMRICDLLYIPQFMYNIKPRVLFGVYLIPCSHANEMNADCQQWAFIEHCDDIWGSG